MLGYIWDVLQFENEKFKNVQTEQRKRNENLVTFIAMKVFTREFDCIMILNDLTLTGDKLKAQSTNFMVKRFFIFTERQTAHLIEFASTLMGGKIHFSY